MVHYINRKQNNMIRENTISAETIANYFVLGFSLFMVTIVSIVMHCLH